jgi:hypothetical protein
MLLLKCAFFAMNLLSQNLTGCTANRSDMVQEKS